MSAAVCERKAIYRTNICPVRSVVPCMVYIRMGGGGGEATVKAWGVAIHSEQPKAHRAPCAVAAWERGVAAQGTVHRR